MSADIEHNSTETCNFLYYPIARVFLSLIYTKSHRHCVGTLTLILSPTGLCDDKTDEKETK